MAYTAKFVRDQMAASAAYDRQASSIKRNGDWREVAFEWQTRQTDKAVLFPSYGWVPKSAIAGRAPDGTIVPWAGYREGYPFLLAGWFVEKRK
jgi:hypothetical protein